MNTKCHRLEACVGGKSGPALRTWDMFWLFAVFERLRCDLLTFLVIACRSLHGSLLCTLAQFVSPAVSSLSVFSMCF